MEYGVIYKIKSLPCIKERERTLYLSSQFWQDTINNMSIVVAIDTNGQNYYYSSINLNKLLKQNNKWEKVDFDFYLPKINCKDYEFSIYIWNTSRNNILVDDFEFRIY